MTVLCCSFFLQTRANSEVNNWKWMKYCTDTSVVNLLLQNRHKLGKEQLAETMTISYILS